MRHFFRSWSTSEKVNAVMAIVSVVGGVLSAVTPFFGNAAVATLWIFAGAAAFFGLFACFLLSRPAYQIDGYRNVMSFLSILAGQARLSIWTVRTHTGPGDREEGYFEIIRSRVVDRNGVEDFRRVVRLTAGAIPHVRDLAAKFGGELGVKVKGFTDSGPELDFAVFDGEVAVIGFPMDGGGGNVGAIVLRRRRAVRGVEAVFNALWRESTELFVGSPDNWHPAFVDEVVHKAERLLDRGGADGTPGVEAPVSATGANEDQNLS